MTLFDLFTQHPRYLFYEILRALTHYTMWLFSLYLQDFVFTYIYPMQFSWVLHTIILLVARSIWLVICARAYNKSHNPSATDFFDKFYKPDYLYRNVTGAFIIVFGLFLFPFGWWFFSGWLYGSLFRETFLLRGGLSLSWAFLLFSIILKATTDIYAAKRRLQTLKGQGENIPLAK